MKNFINNQFIITKASAYYVWMTDKCITPIYNRGNHLLSINLNGNAQTIVRGSKTLISKPGDIIYIPRTSTYDITVTSPYNSLSIGFEFLNDTVYEPFVFHTKGNLKFEKSFKTAVFAQKHQTLGYEFKVMSELYEILSNMKEKYYSEYTSDSRAAIIKPAVQFIHSTELLKDIKISYLAELCQITPEYLRAIFKAVYGVSPLKYINELETSQAKNLLNSGTYSVSDTAYELGYDDISQFSHKFKAVCGITPSQYLKQKETFL